MENSELNKPLTKETRHMQDPTQKLQQDVTYLNEAIGHHNHVLMGLIDEICRPLHIPYKAKHADLIARLKRVATDLDLSGDTIAWQTVSEAIEALGG
jgi:hypothetical protein